jgi:3-dehydroquinate synthase
VSNLPTVWSNCIAGCWLGGWNTPAAVLLLCLGATLLYTAGMFLNDACDVRWDTQHKRDRPIVAGLVPRQFVAVTGSGLLFGGIFLLAIINQRALAFSVILAAAIVLYDLTHKRISWAPVIMAACRFLLYCTAASVGTTGITPRALFFAAALGAYILGVSYLARTESGVHGRGRLWPLLLCVPIVAALASEFSIATLLFALKHRRCGSSFSCRHHPCRSACRLATLARFLLNFRRNVRSHADSAKVHSLNMSGGFEIRCRFQVPFVFSVFFTEDVFSPANSLLRDLLAERRREKLLVVIEESIVAAMPDLTVKIDKYCRETETIELVPATIILPGGEALKASYAPIDRLHGLIEQHGLSRHSYVAAIGGGALLDVAGFAAATAHRGIRHIRFPSTSLSQADAGVGVKNVINAFGKKNFIGTFAPPFAVINDSEFLRVLPDARKSAGYIEAVKVALIRDANFFSAIESDADALRRFDPAAMRRLIRRSAELHVRHISTSGDPFEFGSARPLDFGHWSAHKLEQLSQFKISHAEAVAIGIALDVIYSRDAGHISFEETERILALVRKLGFRIFAPELRDRALLNGLDEFREHLGGELTVTLLRQIGEGFEVHEIAAPGVLRAIEELQRRDADKHR